MNMIIMNVQMTGVMTWYQVFEYAIGHWLQKATEHTIGCVLCSPGCFSLFRASALMGVMGEDRSTNANIGVMGDDLSDNVNIGDTKIDGFKKGDARKDGVMATYATNSSQPLHYIQFDQGALEKNLTNALQILKNLKKIPKNPEKSPIILKKSSEIFPKSRKNPEKSQNFV